MPSKFPAVIRYKTSPLPVDASSASEAAPANSGFSGSNMGGYDPPTTGKYTSSQSGYYQYEISNTYDYTSTYVMFPSLHPGSDAMGNYNSRHNEVTMSSIPTGVVRGLQLKLNSRFLLLIIS